MYEDSIEGIFVCLAPRIKSENPKIHFSDHFANLVRVCADERSVLLLPAHQETLSITSNDLEKLTIRINLRFDFVAVEVLSIAEIL